jgi:V/A-type H+/Na+-transporting ATPase subunit A
VDYEADVTGSRVDKVLIRTWPPASALIITGSRMSSFKPGKVERVAGPVIVASNMLGAEMYEVVRVGDQGLIGEIIKIEQDRATVQVYEETAGIRPGEKVERSGKPLSVELSPGITGQIYDGIQRPLTVLFEKTGPFVKRGLTLPPVDKSKKWHFVPTTKQGASLVAGDVIGQVKETSLITQKIMVPANQSGKVTSIVSEGDYTVTEPVAELDSPNGPVSLFMLNTWPVRAARGFRRKLPSNTPLLTGTRVIDFFFPIAKGGTATIPGAFGTGKTMSQQQLAKWADASVIVYVGCGERGNEMAEVLETFPKLVDPRSGEPIMNRTVLIANTSNMPIAAREASVYTGITIAEYFRDMGYDVALMADSTSRWAEAMREISGRLEEMPGEEGYPAYLASRLAEFYERSGRVETLGTDTRVGSISIVGAVSPPGGDFSEPVTQNTLRIAKVFWSLDTDLASRRHFPAINWLTSYSLYTDTLDEWYRKNISPEWTGFRKEAMNILQRDDELREIVMLVGPDALSESQRVTLEVARMIKEDFLMQHAYNPADTYCDKQKVFLMMKLILDYHKIMQKAVDENIPLQKVLDLPVKTEIDRMRLQTADKFQGFTDNIESEIGDQFKNIGGK